MPLELTWHIAFILALDGFCLGVGWILAGVVYNAVCSAVLWVLGQRRPPANS